MDQGKAEGFTSSRRSAWYILTICSLLYTVNYMDRQVLSVTMESIRCEMGLSDGDLGIIQTVFFMSMAVFAVPASFFIDRWSRKKAIAVMAALWSVFTFATGLGRNFLGVLVPRAFVGVGEAGFTSGGIPLIAAAFPASARARMMGLFNMAIPIGSAAGMILGGYIAKTSGWRMAFFIFAVPGIVLSILSLFMEDYRTTSVDESGQKVSFFRAIRKLFSIPTLRWMYFGFAMQNVMLFSTLTWLPAYIMRAHGSDPTAAGLTVGMISMMSILGSLLGGILADAWQKSNERGRMLTAVLGLIAATVLGDIALYLDIKGIGFALALLNGMLVAMPIPVVSAVSQDVAPLSLKGASWGMNAFCCYVLGGGWAPWIVGSISDSLGGGAHGLQIGLFIASAGGLVGALFYWFSARNYAADLRKVNSSPSFQLKNADSTITDRVRF